MKHKILILIALLILHVSLSLIAKASETETILPIADTYVDYWEATKSHGDRDYLEVSEYANGMSIIVLMFDISHVLNLPSEVKLRLFCFEVPSAPSSHYVGVHWCVNNTWSENLTATSFYGFTKTEPPESVVRIDSIDVWYEWKVTDLIGMAKEENYERITLTLEVAPPPEGMARFASKDQPTQGMREYSPQLVLKYFEPKADSLDTVIIVASGLTAIAIVAFLAHKLSKRGDRKVRSKSNLKGREKRKHKRDV